MERQKEQLNGDVATLEKNNKELDAEEQDIKAAIAAAAEAEKKKKGCGGSSCRRGKRKSWLHSRRREKEESVHFQ